MPAAKPSRVTEVLVPGATDGTSSEVENQEVTDADVGLDSDTQNTDTGTEGAADADKAQDAAAPAAAQAKTEETPAAAGAQRLGRSQYAQMRAHEVDATTLTSAVLTKDGWVCPPTLTPAAKRGE